MNRSKAVHLTLLLALLCAVSCSRTPICPLTFSRTANPITTNAALVSITVTNLSNVEVHFEPCPEQVLSNGMWTKVAIPYGKPLSTLKPRATGTMLIPATALNTNVRVPILWGYGYTALASRLQELMEDFSSQVAGRGLRGLLYTNCVLTNLTLNGANTHASTSSENLHPN